MSSAVAIELLSREQPIGPRLEGDLARGGKLSVAVAYAKESSLAAVNLERFVERSGCELELLAGTDFALTELGLLRRLEPHAGVRCRVFHRITGVNFHPKLYLVDQGERRVAYVGSSNLTLGGLRSNIETNIRLEGPRQAPELRDAEQLFRQLFDSEYATPLTPEFEARYTELQQQYRTMQARYPERHAVEQLEVAERLLVGQYRAGVANKRRLLVVTPENFALCMRHGTWGHQKEHQIRAYRAGDVFFFHVTGRRGIAAMGMFTGLPYFDNDPIWQNMGRGSFPWRMKFVTLGELRTGINTKEALLVRRPGAPSHWFNGFIQSSHSLDAEDFGILHRYFEAALRLERGLEDTGSAAGPRRP
jgi:HKD family nuclease